MTAYVAPSPRSSEQIQRLIVDAASKEFAEAGYRGATMRSIAAVAGISLSVLHRHFPNKRALLSAAAVDPFLRSFDEFADAWRRQGAEPASEQELMRELVRDLYVNVLAHRRTLVSLVAAGDANEAELLTELRAALRPAFDDLRSIGEHEGVRRRFSTRAAQEGIWLVVAMIMGVVLTDDFLPGRPGHVEDDDAAITAITRFSLGGVLAGSDGG